METLADALVQAMAHIDRTGAGHAEESAEYRAYIRATTAIFAVLGRAGIAEQNALAAAAERAAEATPSPALKEYYGGWMEGVFAGSWSGNRRAAASGRGEEPVSPAPAPRTCIPASDGG